MSEPPNPAEVQGDHGPALPNQPWVPPALFERLVHWRRDIHQFPELSFEEHRTAEVVERALAELGIPARARTVKTGVIADIEGDAQGPLVVLRADLDALPLPEQTDVPWASKVANTMHACGHDAHTAMLLGAGALLAASPPPGRVRLLFQPAEEKGNGALHVAREGWVDGAAGVFGVHVDPFFDVGQIVAQPGPMNASSLSVFLHVTGKGGHGGKPHEGVDAVVVAAHLVLGLQSIASREVHPGRPVVVTIGKVQAGTGHNVLAAEARLDGTVRCFDPAVQEQVRVAILRVAEHTAAAFRATVQVRFGEGCPAVLNDPAAAELARTATARRFGPEAVARLLDPNMGAEDFSFFLQRVPGAYVRIGARPFGGVPRPTHSPQFDLDERCIAVGAAYFDEVARLAITDALKR